MTNVKRIETYSLFEFCQEVQTAIQDGYTFDFESNENFPTAFGSLLVCGLIKAGKKVEEKVEAKTEVEVETDAQTEQTEEVVQNEVQTEAEVAETPEPAPAKRGPKPKAK
jgi:hypothetical protein